MVMQVSATVGSVAPQLNLISGNYPSLRSCNFNNAYNSWPVLTTSDDPITQGFAGLSLAVVPDMMFLVGKTLVFVC